MKLIYTFEDNAIDNDDVLFPVGQNYCCDYHNHYYQTDFKFEDLTEFNLELRWGVSKQEVHNRERHYYRTSFYHEMEPMPGAYEGLEYLSKESNQHLITGRGKDVIDHTHRKLRMHFESHHFKSTHHTGPFEFGGHQEQKADICVRLNAYTLFDDYLTTLINASHRGILGILFDKPWNQSTDMPKTIHRVHNWEHAIETYEKLKKKYMGKPILTPFR